MMHDKLDDVSVLVDGTVYTSESLATKHKPIIQPVLDMDTVISDSPWMSTLHILSLQLL